MIRFAMLLIMFYTCMLSPHYAYAQPAPDMEKSDAASTEAVSTEAEEESDNREKMDEVLEASDKLDQHSMDLMSDNN